MNVPPPRSSGRSGLLSIGFCLALAFWGVWMAVGGSVRLWRAPLPDDPLERFHLLRGRVAARVIGYATDAAPGSDAFAGGYYAVRYGLAPQIVEPDDEHRFVIANFASSAALTAYARQRNALVHARPDLGLALIERPDIQP